MYTKYFETLKKPEVIGVVYITVGSFINSFFGYLLQFFLGRTLSVLEYGTFNALLSLSYLVGVPAAVFGTSLIKTVANLFAKQEFNKLTALFWKLLLLSTAVGIVLFGVLYLLSTYISMQLRIEDAFEVVFFGILMGVSFIHVIPNSFLQGLLRYRAFGIFSALNGFVRFLIPAVIVLLGFKVKGAFLGLALAGCAMVLVSYIPLKKNLTRFENSNLIEIYSRLLAFSIPVMFVNFGMMLLNNIDMLLVKKYFDPEIAGYYAGTVTLGKILLFGASTITLVMFPKISNLYSQNINWVKSFELLFKLQLFVVACGVAAFSIFPKLFTVLFFGNSFINSVQYLPRFTVFIALYVLVNFMVFMFLAIDKPKVFIFLLPAVLIQYILLTIYNQNIFQIININIIITAALFISLLGYYFKVARIPAKP